DMPPLEPGPEGFAALHEWVQRVCVNYQQDSAIRGAINDALADDADQRIITQALRGVGRWTTFFADRIRATGSTGIDPNLAAVADWPGFFPSGPEVVRLLVAAGADPNARKSGESGESGESGDETPLHWAASSDDAHVAAALIDAGADINAPDGSIGTPLGNAV